MFVGCGSNGDGCGCGWDDRRGNGLDGLDDVEWEWKRACTPCLINANPAQPNQPNPGQVRNAFAAHRTRLVLSLLGLKRCADTIVGNEKARAVL